MKMSFIPPNKPLHKKLYIWMFRVVNTWLWISFFNYRNFVWFKILYIVV